MDALLSRHLPVTTDRLEFSSQKIDPPPIITPRINFVKRLNTLKRVTRDDTQSTTRTTDNNMDVDVDDSGDSGDTSLMEHNTTIIPDFSSDSGGEDVFDTTGTKIPKPRGQAGHPGSGGYSLDFVLRKWGSTLISDVNVSPENSDNNHRSFHFQKLVKREADRLLDTSSSYRLQNPAEIDNICVLVSTVLSQMIKSHCCMSIKVTRQFPIVSKYQGYWPVHDMLKLHLKYTSESSRKGDSARRRGKGR